MKKLLLFLITFSFFLGGFAQSAQNRYTSRMTRDGSLFFISPQKLGKVSGIKRFEYDMTLLSWTDSVTVNFTFESSMMVVPENFCLIIDNNSFKCDNYSTLFIDIKKKHYEIRITSKFPGSTIKKFIASPVPPIFVFFQDEHNESATYSEKTWGKERKKLSDIYQIYLYSK